MSRAPGTTDALAKQVGWWLRHCVRVERDDYVGLIRRTRKDRIGFWHDYAVVRATDRRDLEAGDLWCLPAVRLERGSSNRAALDLCEPIAWTTSSDKAYAKFQAVIVAGRKPIAGGLHRRRTTGAALVPNEMDLPPKRKQAFKDQNVSGDFDANA